MNKSTAQRIAMKGVIVKDGKVLVIREAATYGEGTQRGRYHMPGGRVEIGESFEEALRREILEESGLEVTIEYPLYVGEWYPVIKDTPTQIIGVFFVCTPKTDKVVLSTEHDDFKWIDPKKRADYDIMDPEDKVIDTYAAQHLRQGRTPR
jgi:8-oxo-dGTP diphosphatase